MVKSIILLILGMVFLIKGADFFVSGASKIAKSLKIPSLIIGLTLVSVGTSAPELSVSLTASVQGKNDMSFGNVIGSNIFNTFVVIGVSSLFVPLTLSKEMKKYDMPILIGIYFILILFTLVTTPYVITTIESIIIFALTFVYILHLILRSRDEIKNAESVIENTGKWYINILLVGIGLAGIIFGGDFVVDSASYIAIKLGMSELLVGLTIVAVGTSLPELVTSIVAARKGENDIAIGNAIGSCIFNIILILGLSGIILPISIDTACIIDLLVMLASAVIILLLVFKNDSVSKKSGIFLITIYVLYLTYIILRNLGVL